MAETSTYVEKWSNTTTAGLTCVGFSLDGKLVAYGGSGGLTIASAANGHLGAIVLNQYGLVSALEWLASGHVVCAFLNGTIAQIALSSTRLKIAGLTAKAHTIECIAVHPGGRFLATGSASDIRVWNGPRNGHWVFRSRLSRPKTFQDNIDAEVVVTSIHFGNEEGGRLLVSYRHHGIQIWDVKAATVVANILNTSTALGRTSLSPDMRHLAVVMQTGIDIHDIEAKVPRSSLRTCGGLSSPVAFIHNGDIVLAPCDRGKSRLWDTAGGSRLQTLNHLHDEEIIALAGYNDGRGRLFRIATLCSHDIHLWETVVDTSSNRIRRSQTLFVLVLLLGPMTLLISLFKEHVFAILT